MSRLASQSIAQEALAAFDGREQVEPFSARAPSLDLATAYAIAADIRRRREARGERAVGRKIGFTNRNIWAQYGVDRPIWGYVYDTTLHDLAARGGRHPLQGLREPQIEPEIVFGLSRAPERDMDDAALLDCIAWAAHGFEIVHSIFPGWRFAVADTVAAFGLHGALLLGKKMNIADMRDPLVSLNSFTIELLRDGAVVDRGGGANVLDGPLSALRHLVEVLDGDSLNPPLQAGDIVTTGTLTRAFPVKSGETWTTLLAGIELPGLRLTFG
ncbi:MAG: fumarylacetoacetate hydrolase family protein [Pseudorhodoplanes sp.]|nr:fumarylacetoacetate hydrolase family protein [Pseudorhodoplanes sp.]